MDKKLQALEIIKQQLEERAPHHRNKIFSGPLFQTATITNLQASHAALSSCCYGVQERPD
eukprot:CAMPEP_0177793452 /NCGR_PEP_ID=MMETSP0491_2-20121128/25083_1 /TAXON_ID=63592 /ORGANISM="Tetraselmis chuii, Strain PLY429" /LENGTH=59 /DNA_ID=CAMNT_0019315969 /DNA_START=436 /DNA_END=613 /DNA_ORIENTATION=+